MPYSTQLFLGALDDGSSTLYTVPAQYVAVIRDLELYGNFADNAEVAIGATIPGPLTAYMWVVNPLEPGAWVQWHGRVVLEAGHALVAATDEAGALLIASGYLLSAP